MSPNRRDEPNTSMSTTKKVGGGVAILLALALIIGIPVGIGTNKPQVPIPGRLLLKCGLSHLFTFYDRTSFKQSYLLIKGQ